MMNFKVYGRLAFGLLCAVVSVASPGAMQTEALLDAIRLPPGFELEIFADSVPGARSLAHGDDGTIYVGTRETGKVYALRDADGDGRADETYVLASNLYMPNGVAFAKGSLYVAEVNRILRYDHIAASLENPPTPKVIYDKLPKDRHHGWKYLRVGPDGNLYTTVGAPCNICESDDEIYATLIRIDADGSGHEVIARGVRNSVGFDWAPGTGQLFFTENGRDYLGDDRPPDELNRLESDGAHFGYPYCHGGTIADPEYGRKHACDEFVPPVWKFPAHVAPLGMRFYRGRGFPDRYKGRLFVAQHGSWNRSEPQGYRVVTVRFQNSEPVAEEVFAEGWLQPDGRVLGRPVDVLEQADGTLLISDDDRGVIYRVTFRGNAPQ